MARALKVTGLKELERKLAKGMELKDVKEVIQMNGAELQAKAMKDAPVDTGFLKRSIVSEPTENGFGVIVGSTADYAPYLIYGTRFMASQDFLRANFFAQRKKFLEDLKRIMK